MQLPIPKLLLNQIKYSLMLLKLEFNKLMEKLIIDNGSIRIKQEIGYKNLHLMIQEHHMTIMLKKPIRS